MKSLASTAVGLLGLMSACLTAIPAAAQDAPPVFQPIDDWDLTVDPTSRVTLASSAFSSGQALAVRCMAGKLDVLVVGVPSLEGASRYLEVGQGDAPPSRAYWFNDGGTVFSNTPAATARALRGGGRLDLSVAVTQDDDGPLRRYQFNLPAASASVRQVLEACDTPLEDARDNLPRWVQPRGYPHNIWRSVVSPDYPQVAASAGIESGFAVLSCLVGRQGRLSDCTVEHESDKRADFGRAALRSAAVSRLSESLEGGPKPGEVIIFNVRFQTS